VTGAATFGRSRALVLACGLGLIAATALPSTSYTSQQAYAGRLDYYTSCAECHGAKLEGVFGPALAGRDDNLKYQAVSAVYGYMTVHMPHGNPGGLPRENYVAIMAFLMQSHGLAAGTKPLTQAAIAADAMPMGSGR
jgi:mono/diheme cytochrome c family protein